MAAAERANAETGPKVAVAAAAADADTVEPEADAMAAVGVIVGVLGVVGVVWVVTRLMILRTLISLAASGPAPGSNAATVNAAEAWSKSVVNEQPS